ncbi:MAG TPA: FAD-binding oxidoreductase [Actinomycetes bacterium]|nr:FAD-binding oxidoreductase [Actinomycetes bacterium]
MSPSTSSIDGLKGRLAGRVIEPTDSDYDSAREVFYGGFDRRPAAIARVVNDDDIRHVVDFAASSGAELAVRAGGHSVSGASTSEGGIVLDLRELKGLDIDVEGRTAVADAGLTAGEYTSAAAAHGLATGFGDTATVGISGITLGGGVGFLVRKHGLTIDNVIGADVVTANGEVLRVDAETNPDLFWAIRGGGANFGVVSRFRFKLHPVDTIVGGMLFLPATPDTVEGFMELAANAPEELSTVANVMPAPPMPFIPAELHGSLILMAFLCYAGDTAAGEKALAPFRSLATPLADMIRPMTYPEMFPMEPEGPKVIAHSHTGFVDEIPSPLYSEILKRLEEPVGQMRVVQLRPLGGAMGRVPNDATAFGHRSRRIMVNVATLLGTEEDRPAARAWVDDLVQPLHGSDETGYVNFLSDEGPERVRQAYPGDAWNRLRELKRQYDPTNLFRKNQNIPPAE